MEFSQWIGSMLHILQTIYDYHLNFTWSVRKLVVVDANDPVVRLDEDKCLLFSCLFDAKELVTSGKIGPELK